MSGCFFCSFWSLFWILLNVMCSKTYIKCLYLLQISWPLLELIWHKWQVPNLFYLDTRDDFSLANNLRIPACMLKIVWSVKNKPLCKSSYKLPPHLRCAHLLAKNPYVTMSCNEHSTNKILILYQFLLFSTHTSSVITINLYFAFLS